MPGFLGAIGQLLDAGEMHLVVMLASACSWSSWRRHGRPVQIAAACAPAGRRRPAAPGRCRDPRRDGQLLDAGEMYLVMMLAGAGSWSSWRRQR
jgi:hypothetical protein